ncbi:MAG: hypothetical protein KGI41_03810 [Patescibacteria group bacterium]|nr:hypothetical protein [Patescibacteria group bacterium]MDE1966337.1 hypothetical protein [Patescibacteria group bacterium]
MQIPWLLIALLGLNFLFSATGDSLSKMWATYPSSRLWAVLVLGCSVLAAVTWMLVIRRTGLAVGSSIMLLLTMIATVLAGLFMYKEQITRGEGIGVVLGIVAALFLLNIIRLP